MSVHEEIGRELGQALQEQLSVIRDIDAAIAKIERTLGVVLSRLGVLQSEVRAMNEEQGTYDWSPGDGRR